MSERCFHCGNPLNAKPEIVAMKGMLFCCEDCAVQYTKQEIIDTAEESAQELFNEEAEIISPIDAGLVSEAMKGLITYIQLSTGICEDKAIRIAAAVQESVDDTIETTMEDLGYE